MMLGRALEVATDFVDAAGPDHRIVDQMIAANDRRSLVISGQAKQSSDWRTSALTAFDLAQREPNAEWVHDHTALVVRYIQRSAADLDMNWTPPPQLRP